jgi:hypothetical protein
MNGTCSSKEVIHYLSLCISKLVVTLEHPISGFHSNELLSVSKLDENKSSNTSRMDKELLSLELDALYQTGFLCSYV